MGKYSFDHLRTDPAVLAHTLDHEIHERRWSYQEAALRSGITANTISAWARGVSTPNRLQDRKKLAEWLNTLPSEGVLEGAPPTGLDKASTEQLADLVAEKVMVRLARLFYWDRQQGHG